MVFFLSVLCLTLIGVLGFLGYHALRWVRVIFLIEDELSEAIEVHERTIQMLENLTRLPVFFDSPEIKAKFDEALQDVKICQIATQKLVQNFTQLSKQRYIRLVDKNEEDE